MKVRIKNYTNEKLIAKVYIVYNVGRVCSESTIDVSMPFGTPPSEIIIELDKALEE